MCDSYFSRINGGSASATDITWVNKKWSQNQNLKTSRQNQYFKNGANINMTLFFRMYQTIDRFFTCGLQKHVGNVGLILKLRDVECAGSFCFEKN